MKLEKLYLRNFRCYERSEVDLEEDLTVFIAPNGMGKTAILDAIAIGFSSLYRGFPGVKTSAISQFDIRVEKNEQQANGCILAFFGEHKGKSVFWGRQKRRNTAVPLSYLVELQDEANQIRFAHEKHSGREQRVTAQVLSREILEAYNSEEAFDIPLVVYFGTERSVRTEVKRRRGFKRNFDRFDAVVGALDSTASFRKALEWFNAAEEAERREKISRKDFKYSSPELDAVRRAICELLPSGHENPRIELRPLRFVIDQKIKNGQKKTLRLGQLSDGYRIVLAMVMDLARRMVEAQSEVGSEDPLATPSIVLIDEVDLHLHPEWQQTILTDLRRVFPKTQFIVTTHSPQVLTTVPARSLRRINFDKSGAEIESGFEFLSGARAEYVLEDVLGVSSRPAELPEVKDLRRYQSLVEADKWDTSEAQMLRDRLNKWGRGHETELERIDVDIKVRAFRRSKSK